MTTQADRLEAKRKRGAEKYAALVGDGWADFFQAKTAHLEGSATLAPMLLKFAAFCNDQYVGDCRDNYCAPYQLCTNCEAKKLIAEFERFLDDQANGSDSVTARAGE